MFKGLFRPKNKLEKAIKKYGMDAVVDDFSKVIIKMLPSREIAYQFILEELDAAYQGNEQAVGFALASGIDPDEFKGSMDNSRPEVDGPGGPQQTLLNMSATLMNDINVMVKFRTGVVNKVMKYYQFGFYGVTIDEMFPSLRMLHGDKNINYEKGVNLLLGQNGEDKNLEDAIFYIKGAASQGHEQAQVTLDDFYRSGSSVKSEDRIPNSKA